jgi:hypothetical protein
MADELSVSKSVAYIATGVNAAVEVSKVVAYILLEPGVDESDDTIRRSLVFSNIVRKPTR